MDEIRPTAMLRADWNEKIGPVWIIATPRPDGLYDVIAHEAKAPFRAIVREVHDLG